MILLRRLTGFLGLRREAAGQPPAPPPGPPAVPVHAVGDAAPPLPLPAVLTGPAVGLTPRDMQRLAGVHPDLVRVVVRARARVPFFVAEGVRSIERQRELVAVGKSRTLRSRHLVAANGWGHAVDLYPITDKPIPALTREDMLPVVTAMRRAAADEGVALVHGHDWGWDSPHHELDRVMYPD